MVPGVSATVYNEKRVLYLVGRRATAEGSLVKRVGISECPVSVNTPVASYGALLGNIPCTISYGSELIIWCQPATVSGKVVAKRDGADPDGETKSACSCAFIR